MSDLPSYDNMVLLRTEANGVLSPNGLKVLAQMEQVVLAHTSQKRQTSKSREVAGNGEVSADEVEAVAEAVFDLEANPQRWSTTTESMRVIYRASIRKALMKARAVKEDKNP